MASHEPMTPRCVAHGAAKCSQCSQNPGSCAGDNPFVDPGCGAYAEIGMHWDTCPNRVEFKPAAQAEGRLELDPEDPFESVLVDIVATNRKKRADYAGSGDPWANFRDTAHQLATVPGIACEALIATKQSRLRNLLTSGRSPQNESVEDTVLDRAVYGIIALALYRAGLYSSAEGTGNDS